MRAWGEPVGALLVDHRHAGGGVREERDTTQCRHCEAVIELGRDAAYAWCGSCGGPVCETARCATTCVPFLRRLEASLARWEFARRAGLATR